MVHSLILLSLLVLRDTSSCARRVRGLLSMSSRITLLAKLAIGSGTNTGKPVLVDSSRWKVAKKCGKKYHACQAKHHNGRVMATLTRSARILVLVGAFGWSPIVQAQQDPNSAQSHAERHALTAPAQGLDAGKSEFVSSCAPCHGADGKGDGPLGTQLKTKPADLSVLTKKNGGAFPFSAAYEFIDGRKLTQVGEVQSCLAPSN